MPKRREEVEHQKNGEENETKSKKRFFALAHQILSRPPMKRFKAFLKREKKSLIQMLPHVETILYGVLVRLAFDCVTLTLFYSLAKASCPCYRHIPAPEGKVFFLFPISPFTVQM